MSKKLTIIAATVLFLLLAVAGTFLFLKKKAHDDYWKSDEEEYREQLY